MTAATGCLTPGAIYHIAIQPGMILCVIDLPPEVEFSAGEAAAVETELHDAAEQVLAGYFRRDAC